MYNVIYKFNKKVVNFFIIYFYIEINKVIYAFICIKNYFFRKVLFFKLFKLINFAKVASMVNSLKNLGINFIKLIGILIFLNLKIFLFYLLMA